MPSLNFEDETQRFREWFEDQHALFARAVTALRGLLSELLADSHEFAPPVVSGRVKARDECIAKFSRKYQSKCEAEQTPYEIKDYITDIIGLRVVCLYESDVATIRKVVAENFHVLEETNKSASLESHDDTFGYKGLHLDLKLKENRSALPEYARFNDLRVELQIRTTVQDAWSVLDHKIKYKRNIPDSLRRRINRLAALFELADQEFRNIRDETLNLERLSMAGHSSDESEHRAPDPEDSLSWDSMLNAFTFSQLGEKHFPKYKFEGSKIDGFVGDLKEVNPALSASMLDGFLTEYLPRVNDYRQFQKTQAQKRMNPYTTVRHVMYLADKEAYRALLFNSQRATFDEWLEPARALLPGNPTQTQA